MCPLSANYALGSAEPEQQRLIRQAVRFTPYTEGFLRDAGIREGDRVLDVGSGLGDVSFAVARLVTYRGQVVGLERDASAIEAARTRATSLGMTNIRFVEGDLTTHEITGQFDAVVGRFILAFVPDVVGVVRRLATLLQPGGTMAFQEAAFDITLGPVTRLPLFYACRAATTDALLRAKASPQIGASLYQIFQAAGLPVPRMRCDFEINASPNLVRWSCDILVSVLRGLNESGAAYPELGPLETLPQRLYEEVHMANDCVHSFAIMGAWSQKP